MDIIVLTGPPGSGKSFMGEKLARENPTAAFLDDIRTREGLLEVDSSYTSLLILASPLFCDEKTRAGLRKDLARLFPESKIQWIFFENNADQCRKNVLLRNDGRKVEGTIKRFERSYVVPSGHNALPVYTKDREVV